MHDMCVLHVSHVLHDVSHVLPEFQGLFAAHINIPSDTGCGVHLICKCFACVYLQGSFAVHACPIIGLVCGTFEYTHLKLGVEHVTLEIVQ